MAQPEVTIEIANIEGTRDTVEAQVKVVLDALVNRENFGYKVDIRPCIYAAILDTPTRWEATARPVDKRDNDIERVRVFE